MHINPTGSKPAFSTESPVVSKQNCPGLNPSYSAQTRTIRLFVRRAGFEPGLILRSWRALAVVAPLADRVDGAAGAEGEGVAADPEQDRRDGGAASTREAVSGAGAERSRWGAWGHLMMFLKRMFWVFRAETEPVSSREKPECMKNTIAPPRICSMRVGVSIRGRALLPVKGD